MEPLEGKCETIFYDGHCALCHTTVKFVLKHDRSGNAFRFAPLQGETFRAQVPEELRRELPDSVVLRTADGALLARSDAMIYILKRLGGGWKIQAAILAVIPRPVRDGMYDFIARIRYRVFGTREDLCPVILPAQRQRFDP
ncbi:MAG: DCC1-like thiol-disulfide oxidoreductase family protein [Candidatus Acidiferrales bacterium]